MHVEHLGQLTQGEQIKEWWVSGLIQVPYFDKVELNFFLEDPIRDGRVDPDFVTAIGNFLKLTREDRQRVSQYVFRNYRDFADAVGEEYLDVQIREPADVWRHNHPTAIHVSRRPYGDKLVYVQIAAECDWEIEHGLQFIYRNGNELSRVSAQDGHLTYADAYGLSDAKERIC